MKRDKVRKEGGVNLDGRGKERRRRDYLGQGGSGKKRVT